MKSLSIEDALQWTQRFVAQEWKLLLPVALAFVALPDLAFNLTLPKSIGDAAAKGDFQLMTKVLEATPWVMPAGFGVQLLGLAGALSIAALALVPRISVREAITLGLQRLYVLVAAILLFFLASLVLVVAISALLTLSHVNLLTQTTVLLGIMIGLVAVIWMRLIVLAAVVVASRAGPIASIRLAWELTTNAFWRILGCILIYTIGGKVVVFASTFAIGAMLILVCNAAGAPTLGPTLSIVLGSLLTALFWGGFHVLAVGIYRQLGGSIRGV